MQGKNVNTVARAWGANPPDWIAALATKCDETSQVRVGRELDCSPSAVNQVLARTYGGRMDRFEAKVRGRYMQATLECPVLGEISTADCIANQKHAKSFTSTNPLRVRLFRACRTCPNREAECDESKTAKKDPA